jgi:hypothetical protein
MVEVEGLGVVVVIGPLVVVTLMVDEEEVLEEVEMGPVALMEQFPSWHTPYPQNEGPVPPFPAALQQSPRTPAHCL